MKRLLRWIGILLIVGFGAFCLGLGLSFFTGGAEFIRRAGLADELAYAQRAIPGAIAGTQSARHTIVVDVARQVSPAVVSIGVTKRTYMREYDMFGGDLFFAPYNIMAREREFPYLGSGFVIDSTGRVLTNYHVIEDASSITVTLTDRRTYPARLLDADRYVDVALLQLESLESSPRLPVIALGDSDSIMIGETVLAVGNPYGPLIADPRPSVSTGVVSAVQRSFRGPQQQHIYQDMIQTDAAINPGNSGGPLINLAGEVIGINTFIFSRSGGSENIGFSIPINRARRVVDEIIQFGKVRDIRVDFDFLNLSPYIIQLLELKTDHGVLVTKMEAGGPAARAGLQLGDVIVAIGGRDIRDARDLLDQFLTRTVGEELTLGIMRAEQSLELTYQIEEGSAR